MKIVKEIAYYKSFDGNAYDTKKECLLADKQFRCNHKITITHYASEKYTNEWGTFPTVPSTTRSCSKCGFQETNHDTSGKNYIKI